MIGTKLAHYEITTHLGSGGMGDVYQATDTKLGRSVAIKFLPEAFSHDTERVARFQHEARVLASLNHSNIAAIYGVEETDSRHFLVMELVSGETLANRIKRGAIPIEEALPIAKQIAEALEEAHEKGIIHRDLKPANIKITPDGKVKVLDFGLAKAYESGSTNPPLSDSPTISMAATNAGVILGTAAYMSPEQARGRAVNKRTDIWALGCVLYEMLTGKPAFGGDDVTEILASVVKSEPDWSGLPAATPGPIRRLLRRCLEKDLKKRFHDIGDVRYELAEVLAEPSSVSTRLAAEAGGAPARSKRAWIATIVTGMIAAVAGWTLKPAPPPKPAQVHRFEYELPEGRDLRNQSAGRQLIALSPDGNRLAYNSTGGLYLRSMDTADTRLVLGPEILQANPFFSPDGEWVGFFSIERGEPKLKKIRRSGGAAVSLCSVMPVFGANWSTDDTIVYGQPDGVWRVSANGGEPKRIVEAQQGEQVDSPQMLPDGQWVLFTSTRGTGPNRWDQGEIVAASLKSKQRKTLWRGGSDGRYVPTGHLVYAFDDVLYAVPFDLNKLEVTGGRVPIIEEVRRAANPGASTSTANYAFSDTGTLVYLRGARTERTLVLVDRSGAVKRLSLPPKAYISPRLSPDEKKIVVETEERTGNVIWLYDLAGTSDIRQLTLKGNNQRPIWMPDSRHITFASDQDGPMSIYTLSIDGTGAPERLTTAEKGTEHWPESWSSDGSTLSFAVVRGTDSGVWTFSAATRTVKQFVDEPGSIQRGSTFSPDGKWIAYHSQESGANEIYVQPFPVGSKKRITQDGRSFPAWPSRGSELFYRPGGGGTQLFVRTVSMKGDLTFAREQMLPLPEFLGSSGNGYRNYDVSPDGKRFLMMLPVNDSRPQINIVLNWFRELQERVPVK
jgi:eukaryotic-like serine/threonine-protein kinase